MIDIEQSEKKEQRPAATSGHGSVRVLMRVKGLRKAFGGQVVLDGVDLELRESEVVLLRGENGSGKTTLLNILTGNMEPDAGEINLYVNSHPEHFRFPRRWWQELNPWDHFTPERMAHEGVGRTWQDIRLFGSQPLLDNLRVATPEQAGEHPWQVLTQWSRWQAEENMNRACAVDLLRDLGLINREGSSADMISLGQCKRVAVARATRANAKILFLDEPLAGLDEIGVADVLSFLRHLAKEQRITIVIVEHLFNIPLILDIASTVWTLTDGRVRSESVAKAKADPAVKNTTALPALIRELAGSDAVISEEKLPRGAILTRVSRRGIPLETLLTIKELVVRRGHRLVVGEEKNGVVKGFELIVHKGEIVFLQAPNGWGKTSLLEVLAGILYCKDGSIQLDGEALEKQTTWERRVSGLAVVPARENIFNSLTIGEFLRVCAGAVPQATPSISSRKAPNYPSLMMSSLSGGERKRLVLDSLRGQDAKVRVWDEPFSSLDAKSAIDCFRGLVPTLNTATLVLVPSTHTFTEVS